MADYMDNRASGLERVLGVIFIGSLALHCVLVALHRDVRTQALGLNAQSYTNEWIAIDCHCDDDEQFTLAELYAAIK